MNTTCAERGIHVSTMTVTAKVVGVHMVGKEDYERVFAEFLPSSGHQSHRFNNQYTICVPVGDGGRRLNVKIFKNGTLQTSGAKNMADIHDLARVLRTRAHMDIGEYKIAMINSNFDVKHKIDLYKLAIYFREIGMHINYDQQRHPGMHLRYMYNRKNIFNNGICSCIVGYNPITKKEDRRCTKCECHKVSVIVFATGKIVVTGASSLIQILEVHEYLMGIVNTFKNETPPLPRSLQRRRRGRTNRSVGADV